MLQENIIKLVSRYAIGSVIVIFVSRIIFTMFQRNGEWSVQGVKWVEVR